MVAPDGFATASNRLLPVLVGRRGVFAVGVLHLLIRSTAAFVSSYRSVPADGLIVVRVVVSPRLRTMIRSLLHHRRAGSCRRQVVNVGRRYCAGSESREFPPS